MATNVKIVVVGASAVGKTSLLIGYTTDKPPSDEYIPSTMDAYTASVLVDGRPVSAYLWDTMGAEDYDRLRPLSYPQTDVVLLCVSMMSQNSLISAREKFVPELAHHLPNVPFILVGTKEDLMNDEETLKLMKEKGRAAVTEDELRAAANEFGAFAAMICSSRSLHNVRQVFEAAIQRSAFTVK